MDGKTVVVTGANAGIGERIATNLAAAGARVVLACRSSDRAEAARDRIAAATQSGAIDIATLDLANQASIRACAADLLARYPRIDVLVNNAGIQLPKRDVTGDGVERVLATNVVGPHLFTQLLLPRLIESAPSRIVNMASSFAGELDVDDLQFERRSFNATRPYKQSKACNRLLTWELARQLEGTGVTANAVSPGMVRTGLYSGLSLPMRGFMRVLQAAFGVSVEEGADTATWLATADDPAVTGASGVLFEKRAPKPCELADPALESELWARCDALAAPQVVA